MNVPVVLYTGGEDWLADPCDVTYLLNTLPDITGHVHLDYYNHLDFMLGIDAHKQIYTDIIKRMDEHV